MVFSCLSIQVPVWTAGTEVVGRFQFRGRNTEVVIASYVIFAYACNAMNTTVKLHGKHFVFLYGCGKKELCSIGS